MIVLKRGLTFVGCRTCQLFQARYSILSTNYDGLVLQPRFSPEEQQRILETLNKSSTEQLSRFDISQGRIKSLEVWRNKKGNFKSLADVLEVDGLGVKVLEKLCESIVNNNNQKSNNTIKTTANNGKNRKQYLTPLMDDLINNNLTSAVALHLRPTGISWTKICRDGNEIIDWGFYDFSALPKKLLPNDTFQLARVILSKIPVGNVYVFEASPSISMQSQKQASLVTSYNQQLELTSMLLALINTSPKHSLQPTEEQLVYENNVYYLRANLSARLFRTLMGTERVSSTTTVSNLLEQAKTGVKHGLPCSTIKVEEQIMNTYYTQTPVIRELLGQSLLLVITFMELCIYKNPSALHAVLPQRK